MTGSLRLWALPLATFVLALALSIVPLDDRVAPYRPDWVPLILIYWAIARPQHFGLLTAFGIALALDILSGSLMGRHALALLPIIFLALRMHLRMRVALAWQVAVTVLLMLVLYHFLLFWIDGVVRPATPSAITWAPVLTSAMLWPIVMWGLGGLNRDRLKAA